MEECGWRVQGVGWVCGGGVNMMRWCGSVCNYSRDMYHMQAALRYKWSKDHSRK